MKRTAIVAMILFLLSCKPSSKEKENINMNSPADRLIENDFLKYADSTEAERLREALKTSFDIYDEKNYRIAVIDAEELAELSFDFFLPALNKILSKRDIELIVETLPETEQTHDIMINKDTVRLFTDEELRNGDFGDTAPRNFFKKVNQILADKNSDERFYLLYGWNDLHAMLLTSKQQSIIAEYYKNKPKEVPYIP